MKEPKTPHHVHQRDQLPSHRRNRRRLRQLRAQRQKLQQKRRRYPTHAVEADVPIHQKQATAKKGPFSEPPDTLTLTTLLPVVSDNLMLG